VVDLGVEGTMPLCGLLVEEYGERIGLYAELDRSAAIGVGREFVAASHASGDAAKFRPGEVVDKHVGVRGKNELMDES
jgi:hypothetical protein